MERGKNIEQDRGTSLRIAKEKQGHFLTVWGVDATLDKIWVTDSDPAGLNVDETLDEYYIEADGSFTYGTETWFISEVHGLLSNVKNIPPVPEPSTLFLILAGLLVFLFMERKGFFGNNVEPMDLLRILQWLQVFCIRKIPVT